MNKEDLLFAGIMLSLLALFVAGAFFLDILIFKLKADIFTSLLHKNILEGLISK